MADLSTDRRQSRVVTIKTDFTSHVLFALRNGYWTNQPEVNERIMKIWTDKADKGDKVYFLFSVNSSKQFCGLAEMVGPVQPTGVIRGWKKERCHG